jgi:hypothetical protein
MTTLIRSVKASYIDENDVRALCLRCVLGAAGADYLNPEYVVGALREKFGLLQCDATKEEYSILRRRVLLADGETEFA